MASLELRGGIWHIRFRDKRGRSRSQSTKLHSSPKNDILVHKKLIAFEVDLLRGKLPSQAVKIGALLDDVINDYVVNAKKSVELTKDRVKNHLRPFFGELRADRFSAADWREYVTLRQAETDELYAASNGTINRERAILMRGFSLGRQAGRVDAVPYIPRLKENPPPPLFITRNELESLCRHLPEYLGNATRFAFLTGWRLGEIRQLQWRHVSFEVGEIRLDEGTTKNGEGRVFPLTAELRALLSACQTASRTPDRAPRAGIVPREGMPTLTPFVFHYQGRPIGWIYQSWDKAAKAIGKPGLMFKHMRNSAIVEMDRLGIPVKSIMALVGHKTIKMFLHYRRLDSRDLTVAKEMMERAQTVRSETKTSGNS